MMPGVAATEFIYPQHIERADLDALPQAPGIYIFQDEQKRPLYVGKSINLRARVLSHLRNRDEARMLQLSRHIRFERSAGEVGALLREAQLVKQLQPPFNRMLRNDRSLCSLHIHPQTLACTTIASRSPDFHTCEHLYGLFSGRHSALEAYRRLVQEHHLCPQLTGLEQALGGRPCFAHQVGRCRGACCGKEGREEHQQRLFAALHDWRLLVWPFPGVVGIVEEFEGWRQIHLVHRWAYLGSAEPDQAQAPPSVRQAAQAGFDADTYKILSRALLQGKLEWIDPPRHWLEASPGAAATTGRHRRTPGTRASGAGKLPDTR